MFRPRLRRLWTQPKKDEAGGGRASDLMQGETISEMRGPRIVRVMEVREILRPLLKVVHSKSTSRRDSQKRESAAQFALKN